MQENTAPVLVRVEGPSLGTYLQSLVATAPPCGPARDSSSSGYGSVARNEQNKSINGSRIECIPSLLARVLWLDFGGLNIENSFVNHGNVGSSMWLLPLKYEDNMTSSEAPLQFF